jgi:hypothetical protein
MAVPLKPHIQSAVNTFANAGQRIAPAQIRRGPSGR